jgi:membrane protease YdiL (CAAX protease family)
VIGWHFPEYQPGLAWWPLAVVLVALVVINIVNNRVAPQSHYLLWSFLSSVVLIAIGLLDGNSWTDMGLGWWFYLSGFIWAAASIGLVTAFYVIGSLFRKTRQAFEDESIGALSGGKLAFQALVEVPFGTVLLEEIAFRAVLFSMLARRFGVVWAIVISSVLFGIWHVLPSIGTHERNPALGSVVGTGLRANILTVTGSVLVTAVAGGIFALMRIVSGSVIAPMGLHWATNGLGYGFSWVILRGRRWRRKT